MGNSWTVKAHKDVTKKQIPLLKSVGLLDDYLAIIDSLRNNPYENVRSREKLNPRNKQIFFIRINSRHRVVYTINKENHVVKVWSAWSHYENGLPR